MITDDNSGFQQHRHKQETERDPLLMVRNIMNVIFMIGAIVGVIFYLSYDKITGTYIILGAMAVKIAESALRLLRH
ncbi:MAG: hypothetical protein ACI4TW_09070 [Prevotella sp.]